MQKYNTIKKHQINTNKYKEYKNTKIHNKNTEYKNTNK